MSFTPKNIIHFQLKDLDTSIAISRIFSKYNIKYYVYTFSTKDGVIKHGLSADNEWKRGTWGNRVYKQTLGIPGWNNRPDPTKMDTSAQEMYETVCNHFPNITKDDVIITVYDFTCDLTENNEFHRQTQLMNAEGFLVDMHETNFGCMPPGNIKSVQQRPHYHAYTNLFIETEQEHRQ